MIHDLREMGSVAPNSSEDPNSRTPGEPAPPSAAAIPTPFRLPAALRALGHRNYRLFFGGQLISLSGTSMQSVAQSWLVYRLTQSSVLLGFVGFASQFPVFRLAPFGGAAADRHDRHRILIATQSSAMLLALALAALTLSGRVAISHIFVLAALMGCVNAFDIPARARN